MRTVQRQIYCSCGVVLFAWSSTTYTNAEKEERKTLYDERIKEPEKFYGKLVRAYQEDRFRRLRMRKWRRELGIAAYDLEVAKNEFAPLKDDPPKIANLDGIFETLASHQLPGHELKFTETLPNSTT